MSPYNEYCANQADAKETLDAVVSRDKRVRDFLQRCLESPFSRKLDLWSYLDLPRSRLVKYPLLLKAILKVTPSAHQDAPILEKSVSVDFKELFTSSATKKILSVVFANIAAYKWMDMCVHHQ